MRYNPIMRTVKAKRSSASYYVSKNDPLPPLRINLTNYRQGDVHTCGFVAALTVAHYFYPDMPAEEVLTAVRPTPDWGINRHKLVRGLEKLGVGAEFHDDLEVDDLRSYVSAGVPVIVSVWPEEWMNDHWTVVWGFDDTVIHLTNYGHMTLDEFFEEWSDMDMRGGRGASAEAIICTLARAAP